MKKVPVVKITTPDAAGELAGLPLAATVAMWASPGTVEGSRLVLKVLMRPHPDAIRCQLRGSGAI
jgi:hypothetical protein